MLSLKNNKKGFTIIEVLIVLAIGGAIMLVVFLAVPALQRNSRNIARKQEAARIATLVSECLTNKNGVASGCDTGGEIFGNGTANPYTLPTTEYKELTTLQMSTSTAVASKIIAIYAFGYQCDDANGTFIGATPRQYAVGYKTESGGGDVFACING
jgi:prepilin-type N-terminal cleavage/methylation domain-containing protein